MFVNLSKHTYIIYTYTALFYHRILRYLIFVIIYNPLEIYKKKKNRFKISIRNCRKENQWWLKLSNRSIIRDLQIWKESRSKIKICQVCIKFTKLVCSSLLFIWKWLSENINISTFSLMCYEFDEKMNQHRESSWLNMSYLPRPIRSK